MPAAASALTLGAARTACGRPLPNPRGVELGEVPAQVSADLALAAQ